jgi:hypothetical protein
MIKVPVVCYSMHAAEVPVVRCEALAELRKT